MTSSCRRLFESSLAARSAYARDYAYQATRAGVARIDDFDMGGEARKTFFQPNAGGLFNPD